MFCGDMRIALPYFAFNTVDNCKFSWMHQKLRWIKLSTPVQPNWKIWLVGKCACFYKFRKSSTNAIILLMHLLEKAAVPYVYYNDFCCMNFLFCIIIGGFEIVENDIDWVPTRHHSEIALKGLSQTKLCLPPPPNFSFVTSSASFGSFLRMRFVSGKSPWCCSKDLLVAVICFSCDFSGLALILFFAGVLPLTAGPITCNISFI